MSVALTQRDIKRLCGSYSYNRGKTYFDAGRVSPVIYDPKASIYKASVAGHPREQVAIELLSNTNVYANCSCAVYQLSAQFCAHIAAALLAIQHDSGMFEGEAISKREPSLNANRSMIDNTAKISTQDDHAHSKEKSTNEDYREDILTSQLLGMFNQRHTKRHRPEHSRFDTRSKLDVEFICRLYAYGPFKYMLGMELRLGPQRLYKIKQVRQLLEHIEYGRAYECNRYFRYDPTQHSFSAQDAALLKQLYRIYEQEKMFREAANTSSGQLKSMGTDALLLIPPQAWDKLEPLLQQASIVKLQLEGGKQCDFQLKDEFVSLHFHVDRTYHDDVQLDVEGLDALIVLDTYGLVLKDGALLHMKSELCGRLIELQKLFQQAPIDGMVIPKQQIGSFMEQVVPGLMKLGTVHMADTVSEKLDQPELQARLYLDRVRERLLAGLEFQYGNLIINPLEGSETTKSSDRILVRDGERERRIIELMEQSAFAKTEAGYFMEDEDGEYEFLYRILPQLESCLKVYATTAVKLRVYRNLTPPQITVHVDERTEWLEFGFAINGIPEAEIRAVLEAIEEKRTYYRLQSGALLPLDGEQMQDIVAFINRVGFPRSEHSGNGFRLPLARGLPFIDDEQSKSMKLSKSLRQLLANMRNPDCMDIEVPTGLNAELREYQKYGYQWMKTLAHYRFGGILADEMGLGKTIQSIAFLLSELPAIQESKQPALVVAPTSLLYNWWNELQRFAPQLRVVIVDGSPQERSRILANREQADVLITSYPLLRSDVAHYAGLHFHTLLLDEAQAFKNYTTQTAQAVKVLQARYRFALTGTPIENSITELWSIFDAVFPSLFTDRQQFQDLTPEAVAKVIRPFVLRRLKSDVLQELPEKLEWVQTVQLLPEQQKLYLAYLAQLQQETLKHLYEKTFGQNRIKILAGLTRLRQICCHPALFQEQYEGGSAKLDQLLELIRECRIAGRRILVFSQFTSMLRMIGKELNDELVTYFYLDGQTPTRERIELCERFNEGERDVFLISLKAGGTGLNLVGADTVILYDLWWNPAVEQQAADRAHRIGQTSTVQVIRLITHGTVEDKMYELQQKKMNLIEEVLKPGQEELSQLSEQDIRDILMI